MILPWIALMLLSMALLVWPYAVYPLVLLLLPKRHEIGKAPEPSEWPAVSIVVAAYNCANRIGDKIAELFALDYPGEMEIIVVDDGSDDGTADQALAAGAHQVLRMDGRSGKSKSQNAGVEVASHKILVFTDATVFVERDALRHLVRELLMPGVGCVTGIDVSVSADHTDANQGAGLYTRFEIMLRDREAQTGSMLGVNGCLFAVWAENRPPVPPECVDDLYIPLAAVDRGARVTVAPQARAVVKRAAGAREEYRRKVRTFTGGIFTMRAVRYDLPRAYKKLHWRLMMHKQLRWAGPLFAAAALYFSIGLAFRWPPAWLVAAPQIVFWVLAFIGQILTGLGLRLPKLMRLPLFFALAQAALVQAWLRVWSNRPFVVWQPTRRTD